MTGVQFEISITEHCNLNCAYCTHFAPCVTEPEFLPVGSFRKDMKRFSEITGGRIDYLKIMGGEPLLHPEVTEFLIAGREYFPQDAVDLYTNGILLKDMPDTFWDVCRRKDIRLVIARYPGADHGQIERLCAANGVALRWASEPVKVMIRYKFDLTGQQDGAYQHRICNQCGTNLQFRDGKLYPCCRPANIKHFNRYFGTKLKVADADGLDIHAPGVTLDAVKEFIYKQIPFCRYCRNDAAESVPWKPSERNIEEWT